MVHYSILHCQPGPQSSGIQRSSPYLIQVVWAPGWTTQSHRCQPGKAWQPVPSQASGAEGQAGTVEQEAPHSTQKPTPCSTHPCKGRHTTRAHTLDTHRGLLMHCGQTRWAGPVLPATGPPGRGMGQIPEGPVGGGAALFWSL